MLASTMLTLWQRRQELEFSDLGSFWAYSRKVARSHAFKRRTELYIAEVEEVPDRDLDLIHRMAVLSQDRERLYAAADELWLRGTLSGKEGATRLLAAQFIVLHLLSVDEVLTILSPYGKLRREDIEQWLKDLSLLLNLCYKELYWENQCLLQYLFSSGVLHWPMEEREVVRLRYGNGLSDDKIRQMCPSVKASALADVKKRCFLLMPYNGVAPNLALKCEPRKPIQEPGLWRRLVFQYACHDELPHKHILERAGTPASEAGIRLTAAMLNAWLSNGRIYIELARHVSKMESR